MDKMQALHSFWSGFSLKAYDENSVPDNATLPYVTYETGSDDFGNQMQLSANLWYQSGSWAGITAKEQQIAEYIGRGGRLVKYDEGAFWVTKSTPWARRMSEESDPSIRRILLNVAIEFLD